MPTTLRSVTVYCSSSRDIDAHFFRPGADLGTAIARNGWTLVYGGNRVGLMAAVADAARAAGGKVVGIAAAHARPRHRRRPQR